jgi:ferredoxin
MRVHIDEARCQGHTMCALAAPQVFTIRGEDAVSTIVPEISGEVPAELQAAARLGAASCPERAIVITD